MHQLHHRMETHHSFCCAVQGRPGRSLDTHTGAHALQARLVDAVSEDPSLRSLASDAFRSSVRAYAAHPAALKDVFHVKRLHLGHVAHSFALRCGALPRPQMSDTCSWRTGLQRSCICVVLSPQGKSRHMSLPRSQLMHFVTCREAPSMLGKSSNKAELKRRKAEERGGRKTLPAKHKRQK